MSRCQSKSANFSTFFSSLLLTCSMSGTFSLKSEKISTNKGIRHIQRGGLVGTLNTYHKKLYDIEAKFNSNGVSRIKYTALSDRLRQLFENETVKRGKVIINETAHKMKSNAKDVLEM
jgi:hypothetical protein